MKRAFRGVPVTPRSLTNFVELNRNLNTKRPNNKLLGLELFIEV